MSDRRARRHAATREEILAAAWQLAREHGLVGWSLRDLATAVDMRAPSLYGYFASKDAIYDAMYAQGYEQLLELTSDRGAGVEDPTDPEDLRHIARAFFDFAVADPARHQLLFQHVIPGFQPSPASYALAEQVVEQLRAQLAAFGITRPEAVDLATALLTGMTSQQISNDPDGDRWARLLDDAVTMFLDFELAAVREPTP